MSGLYSCRPISFPFQSMKLTPLDVYSYENLSNPYLFSFLGLFLRSYRYTYFIHIAASNTITDYVTDYRSREIFNVNLFKLKHHIVSFVFKFDMARHGVLGGGSGAYTPYDTGARAPTFTNGWARRDREQNDKRLYWRSRKRSPKWLIVLVEPKKLRGTTTTIFRRFVPPPAFKFVPAPLGLGAIHQREITEAEYMPLCSKQVGNTARVSITTTCVRLIARGGNISVRQLLQLRAITAKHTVHASDRRQKRLAAADHLKSSVSQQKLFRRLLIQF